jgi:hypothetical protein
MADGAGSSAPDSGHPSPFPHHHRYCLRIIIVDVDDFDVPVTVP